VTHLPIPPIADAVVDEVASGNRRAIGHRIAVGVIVVLAIGGLLAVWHFTPLRDWLDLVHLVALLQSIGDSPYAPLAVLGGFLLGALMVFPVNVLIAATVVVFGPIIGALYALVGVLISAAALYEVGARLPKPAVRRLIGKRGERLRLRIARLGVPAIAALRVIPVAPYTLVNLTFGAAHIPRLRFLLGTAFGMLPGIIFSALFVDRALAVVARPDPLTYLLLALTLAAIVAIAMTIRWRVLRNAASKEAAT
jgi:phospholipase D1/2